MLCISRNKHWRYISSYHGPWLQLPVELLESLLVLNLDPVTLSSPGIRLPSLPPSLSSKSTSRPRDRGYASLGDHSPPDSPRSAFANLPTPPPFPMPEPGKATPPPIDPGVFRSVTTIRRLIDEASELSVRASSGLSAVALGSLKGVGAGMNASPWATAQSLGLNPLGEGNGGRNFAMSSTRVHRLRALAVQKLAAAYRMDEIASSVMVMQGGSVFDDIAEHVLRFDPNDVDARYVHFFHEKIPSRQLAESTTTTLLDELIAAHPQRLEFYRTRGIVHCFRDEYALAVKDFSHALKEARATRRAKHAHHNNMSGEKQRGKGHKKKGKSSGGKSNGQAPPNGTCPSASFGDLPIVDGPDGEPILFHPSVLPDAPEPIEPQCLFLRAAAYLQHAVFLIEEAILKLENIRKAPTADGGELRLCYIENGRYGGVEMGHPDGPLGKKDGLKLSAYKQVLAEPSFQEQIMTLVKKSMRDHEKFLSHFDSLEGAPNAATTGDIASRAEHAFLLSESLRPGSQAKLHHLSDGPATFTTYHPLLIESHYSILTCLLMLGDFPSLLQTFTRTASVVDGLEGYPVFLPPRSMAQAEFVEVLERLASGWKNGIQPHSLSQSGSGSGLRLAIESPTASAKAKEVERVPTPPSPDCDRLASSTSTLSIGINGSSSSTTVHASPSVSGRNTPSSSSDRVDLVEVLSCARILLAPVAKRQRERAQKAVIKGQKKQLNINIPLHGPRVEIILAWLGAVHLPELDAVA
ncbi:uncharacterized protein LAESUDRAFT_685815 [Laetiporus sulphureus 93-53]|uniref:Uncharacterized protein n=1 Tax=Laetiporus sulphureus 93-53 TaxID=1314785 RepID=A0A165C1G8_9APHY|nr:uncharacterized protein LAESUDRAFT_685815 [Laetiporus sulphureus 93-53]KZT02030.1 hypothetical protein LAESUDRAFT_685815 [Laetiporus sulphureus 93-53]